MDRRAMIAAEDKKRGYRPIISTTKPPRFVTVNENENEEITLTSTSTGTTERRLDCYSWVKYVIYFSNLVFMVYTVDFYRTCPGCGVALLAVGAWLRTDSRFRDFLSERYRQAVDEAFWEAPTLYAFSYLLIVLGAAMVGVAFFGCCGAAQGASAFLAFYAIAVFVLMVACLSSGIFLLYKRDGIDVELSDALNYMVQHYYQGPGVVQEALDRLHQTFRCCGNAGCSDFRVFRQDPPRTCDIRCDGCHYRIWLALRIGFTVTAIVFLIIIFLQLLAIACALYLLFQRRTPTVYNVHYKNDAYRASPIRTIERQVEIRKAPPPSYYATRPKHYYIPR